MSSALGAFCASWTSTMTSAFVEDCNTNLLRFIGEACSLSRPSPPSHSIIVNHVDLFLLALTGSILVGLIAVARIKVSEKCEKQGKKHYQDSSYLDFFFGSLWVIPLHPCQDWFGTLAKAIHDIAGPLIIELKCGHRQSKSFASKQHLECTSSPFLCLFFLAKRIF